MPASSSDPSVPPARIHSRKGFSMKAVPTKAASLSLLVLASLSWASSSSAQETRADQRILDETVLRAEALLKDGNALEAAAIYVEFLEKSAEEIAKLSRED